MDLSQGVNRASGGRVRLEPVDSSLFAYTTLGPEAHLRLTANGQSRLLAFGPTSRRSSGAKGTDHQ